MRIDKSSRIVSLTADEVATAIDAYLVAHNIHVSGPRTIRFVFDGDRYTVAPAEIYVDPSGKLHRL